MTSALNSFRGAANYQISVFTGLLNYGEIDEYLANKSSMLLETFNDEKLRAVYMYMELTGRE